MAAQNLLHYKITKPSITMKKRFILNWKLAAGCCLGLLASSAVADAQNIFVQFPTSGGAGTATIAAPAGYGYSAAAPVSGTSWNTFGESTIVLPTGTAAGTYTFYNNSALVNSVGTSIAETLTISETCPVTLTHANPSTGSGENTIQPGGVMKGAWRNYNNSTGFYITYTIANLPASTPYGIYVYGGTTTSGQGVAINLTNSANWLGANPVTNLVTLNTNANGASVYGSIWTAAGGTTNLMPNLPVGSTATGTQTNGGAWGVLYGQSDSSGNLIFRLGTPAPTGTGSGAYINGFQIVPLSAPSLTGPANQTVTAGNSTTLSATAGGLPAPAFQWQLTNGAGGFTNIPGATSSSLALNNVQYAQNGGVYSLIASNILGTVTNSMTLTVIVTPAISGLNNQSSPVGEDVILAPTIVGVPAPLLQWQFNGTNLADGPTGNGSTISGSTTGVLGITTAQAADSGSYSLIASNAAGIVTNGMTLTVSSGSVAPGITGPADQTVVQTSNATFTVSVSGMPVPTLQWQENGTDIPGATDKTLTLTNVAYAQNGFVYSLIASNSAGLATNSATLYVLVPPVISASPASLVVTNTQGAAFSVTAGGVPAPAYQWYFNGNLIPGATGSNYVIAGVVPTNMGNYTVVVTNNAGSVTSSIATLTVNSTMSAATLAPANGVTGICYDTPLYVTFSSTPSLRSAGKIRIYNVTNSVTPVDTLDMSLNQTLNATYAANIQPRNIGGDTFYSFPVIITGATAAIYPHTGVMTSNQTYYVTVDDGVFADSTGAYFAGVSATNVWQFTTKPAGPANLTNLVVAADGSGDFLTVQGAVDSVPANNTTPTMINVRNGAYREIVDVKSKNNLDFRGQSRAGAVIGYPNNNYVNTSGAPLRSMFVLNGNDCTFENLTITNTTPKGGSQAEAMDVEGTRTIFYNMELDSYQDTFLIHSAGKLVYFQDCLIQGDTDFNWGYGSVYYTNCELRCLSSGGHVTQPRSPQGSNGFAFVNCRITKGFSSGNFDLGRSISTPTTPSEALFANCLMDDVITGYSSDAGTNFSDYTCSNLTATASKSLTYSTHLTGSDPYVIAAQSATNWLYGWTPQVAPNILTNPASLSVTQGQLVGFAISATGIQTPAFQWCHDGLSISGATSATYSIAGAVRTNAGNYTVVVSNGSGSVTSSVATLTYTGNVAPVAATSTCTRPAGYPLIIAIAGNLSTNWSDADADPLALTGGISSTNVAAVSYDNSSVYYTNANDVADQINYTISDGQGGTAAGVINVVVGPAPASSVAEPLVNGDRTVTLNFSGVAGYTYQVDAATNLTPPVVWTPVSTNTAVGGTWQFTDTQTTNYPDRFYRSEYRP